MKNTFVDILTAPKSLSELGLLRGIEIERRFWRPFFTLQDLVWLASPFFLNVLLQKLHTTRSGFAELGGSRGAATPKELTVGKALSELNIEGGFTTLEQVEGGEFTSL